MIGKWVLVGLVLGLLVVVGAGGPGQVRADAYCGGTASCLTGRPEWIRILPIGGLPPKVRSQPVEILNGNPIPCPPSLRKLTGLIVKRPENRSEEDEQLLSKISSGQPKLTTTIELARSLATIIRQQQAAELDIWLEKASKSGDHVWHNFATGLAQDYDAVRAALQLPWSNGPTDGHINRLKYLKRLMYGRGKNDLLRKRVLWQGRWSFT